MISRLPRPSTRLRLAAAIVGVVALSGLGVLLGVRTLLHDGLNRRVEAGMVEEYAMFVKFLKLGRDPTGASVSTDLGRAVRMYLQRTVLGRGEMMAVHLADGQVVQSPPYRDVRLDREPAVAPAWTPGDTPVIVRGHTNVGPVTVLSVPVKQADAHVGMVVMARFTADERRDIDAALQRISMLSIAAIVLSALAAWWVAAAVLRPLRELTHTAQAVTGDDITRRIPDPGGDDELPVLVRTFNSMLDRLEQTVGTQKRFLADAGHELRTPLTIIRGNVDALHDGSLSPAERAETVELLRDEVERMSRLVDDLVALARSQQPDFLHLHSVDIDDVVLGVAQRAEALPGPRWSVRAAPGVITADGERLTQAMLNLVVNAARHTPAGGDVELGVEPSPDGRVVRFWVSDSGPGVPEDEREEIFARWVKGRGRTSAGSGLGLSISRAIAEAHGGTLQLDVGPHGGARFTMTVPVAGPRIHGGQG